METAVVNYTLPSALVYIWESHDVCMNMNVVVCTCNVCLLLVVGYHLVMNHVCPLQGVIQLAFSLVPSIRDHCSGQQVTGA